MTRTPQDPDCYFCRVAAGLTDPFIFENRSFLGIFDTHPVNPGHALIMLGIAGAERYFAWFEDPAEAPVNRIDG